MTSTMRSRRPTTSPSTNGDAARAARAAASNRPTTPLRRRWGRLGAGLGVAIVGAWITTALVISAGDQKDVLVMATDVEQFDVIERADLRVVRLGATDEVSTVGADRLDEVVGRAAAVDLVAGSLITDDQVLARGAELVASDEAVVGVLAGPADAPQDSLRRGTPVRVVVRPVAGSTDPPTEVNGWLWSASGGESSTREVATEVVVPAGQAAQVAAAAADRRVSIVVLAE